MCQRAVGNLFAALVPVPKSRIEWIGDPGSYRSSSLAARGFCARCGTPLSFAYDGSKWICLTLGSLDDPAAVRPEVHYGIESQVPWLHLADELPREPTDAPALANMVVLQSRTGD
ncbi:GFA family protein [Nannocystis radixulma]|uniref:GFA family protein n=1 Tax=Nannocystis radixulma TaxID=2995305 RepID=A0ABT5B9E8_9BACT|nr:GFA family protein [Nannocystis radixulma]MDC0670760.1 GFA family protein [Nannocystis radixulma]